MKRLIAVAALAVAFLAGQAPAEARTYPAGAVQKDFFCTITAPGKDAAGNSTVTECTNGGLGYVVPAGKLYCITHVRLINKYPFNPLRYSGLTQGPNGSQVSDMHTMYLEMVGFSVAAHDPDIVFEPPFPKGPTAQIRVWIDNGMFEAQNVYALVQGYEINLPSPYRGCLDS